MRKPRKWARGSIDPRDGNWALGVVGKWVWVASLTFLLEQSMWESTVLLKLCMAAGCLWRSGSHVLSDWCCSSPLYFGDFCHTARKSLAAMCQHRNKNLVPGNKCLFGMAGQSSQQPTLSHPLSEDLRKGACVPRVVNGKGKQTVLRCHTYYSYHHSRTLCKANGPII